VFYDNWVARDINGTALENAPFEGVFHHHESSARFQRHLPVQVQSCWNGIAILDPAPIYATPHVRFRMARLAEGECSASECSLIGNDYWSAGYGRIIMVPRVKLAYDKVRCLKCIRLRREHCCFRHAVDGRTLISTSPSGVTLLGDTRAIGKGQCSMSPRVGERARTRFFWEGFSRGCVNRMREMTD
jgi:hypothetical protein